MNPHSIILLLICLHVANGTPVIAKWLIGNRLDCALDHGLNLADGQRLFGQSKTFRGVVLAIAATSVVGSLIGLSWQAGAAIGASAMAGDLMSSFTKRRMKLAPSSMALGIDQIPESLLPAVLATWFLPLTVWDVLLTTIIFFVGELLLSRILFKLKIRDRPY